MCPRPWASEYKSMDGSEGQGRNIFSFFLSEKWCEFFWLDGGEESEKHTNGTREAKRDEKAVQSMGKKFKKKERRKGKKERERKGLISPPPPPRLSVI